MGLVFQSISGDPRLGYCHLGGYIYSHDPMSVSVRCTHAYDTSLKDGPLPFRNGGERSLSCCPLYINSKPAVNALQLIPKMNLVGPS